MDHETPEQRARIGVAYGLAAYLFWGFIVVYFKAVASVAPLEVLAHRVVWSVPLLVGLLALRGRLREAVRAVRHRRTALALLVTTALIALNWFTFIWAVTNEQVLQASLGYYINPLVNVLLGFVFLRERLRRAQGFAVALAATAVVVLTVRVGELPVVALVLAFTFGIYGLFRKTMIVDGLVGLTVETSLLMPVGLGYLVWLQRSGSLVFAHEGWSMSLLLLASGAVTALPLLWFANAARRINLATVGLLQYIAPSIQFVMAVLVFGETFRRVQLVAFALIWGALAVYSWDAVRVQRRRVALAR